MKINPQSFFNFCADHAPDDFVFELEHIAGNFFGRVVVSGSGEREQIPLPK